MINKYGELLKLLQHSIYIDTEKFASNYKLYLLYNLHRVRKQRKSSENIKFMNCKNIGEEKICIFEIKLNVKSTCPRPNSTL